MLEIIKCFQETGKDFFNIQILILNPEFTNKHVKQDAIKGKWSTKTIKYDRE